MSRHTPDDKERTEMALADDERNLAISTRRRSLRLSIDESSVVPTAANMMCVGKYSNVLRGRIFFVESSEKTDEFLASPEGSEDLDTLRSSTSVISYNASVMAFLLKNRLQTHYFYSKHCAELLEGHPKRRKRSGDPDFRYKFHIRKNIENIFSTGVSLEDTIAREKKLYQEMMLYNINYPIYLNECLLSIEDHKNTLKEQVINKEAKQLLEQERAEIRFIGEICSRLLAVTKLDSPELLDVLYTTRNVLNEINID